MDAEQQQDQPPPVLRRIRTASGTGDVQAWRAPLRAGHTVAEIAHALDVPYPWVWQMARRAQEAPPRAAAGLDLRRIRPASGQWDLDLLRQALKQGTRLV